MARLQPHGIDSVEQTVSLGFNLSLESYFHTFMDSLGACSINSRDTHRRGLVGDLLLPFVSV